MYHHFVAYSESVAQLTNTDINAVADEVLQSRNSHLIMSERFDVIAAHALGTTLTRLRFGNIGLTFRGVNHLFPTGRVATVDSRPGVIDRRLWPLELPMNEEITLEATTDAAGPAQVICGMWLAKPQWSQNIPLGMERFTTRATAVVAAGSETTWTALAPLVMERDLFNGVYAVVGCQVIAAAAFGFRLFFPSQRQASGRQLRPGGLVMQAIGDYGWPAQSGGMGEWGRFHTFEMPSIQTVADAAGGTYEVRLDLVYLGERQDLLMGA